MAKGWKRAAEILLNRSGLARAVERGRAPSATILAYHNIVPEGEAPAGDASLHTDQAAFGAQLDWLRERYTIVSLAELVRIHGRGAEASEAPRVAITFDDAYRGTLSAGLAELARRDLPATVFVPPGLLGAEGFWWDLLASGGRPLDPGVREHALQTLAGQGTRIMSWAREEGLAVQDLPDHARPVTEHELIASIAGSGVSLGAHTWSHPNLSRLSGQQLDDELRGCRRWLLERTDAYVDFLAYPYGLVSEEAVHAAADVFHAALLVAGGAAVLRGEPVGTPHRIPRVNVARGVSVDGLALRLAGIV